jgi:hypothetical protein
LFGVLLREPASFHDVQVSQQHISMLLAAQLTAATADRMSYSRTSLIGTLAGLLAAVLLRYCRMAFYKRCC